MAEYFSHDYDTREDEKIQNLIFKHGMEGYGIFWSIVELLYKNDGYMQSDYPRIAFALHSHNDKIESVINDFDLFKMHDNSFTSTSVLHRIKLRKGKSATARKAAKVRWQQKKQDNANALQTQSDSNAIKETKVKERKVKENKEKEEKKKFRDLVTLTEIEYKKLLTKHGQYLTDRMLDKLDNYKGSNGKKYVSDYKAILSWVEEKVLGDPKYQNYLIKERKIKAERERRKQQAGQAEALGKVSENIHIDIGQIAKDKTI